MSWLSDILDWLKKQQPKPTPAPAPIPTPTPVPTPTPTPTPAPVSVPTSSTLIHASMFVDASGSPYGETINRGVTSPQAWASCHGKGWENGYRDDILTRLQAAGSDTLVYIVDKYYRNAPVLAMCLADMGHPDDGHHADPSEGWYDRSIAKGVKRHIAIFRDSPDTGVSVSEQAVKEFVGYYKGSRFEVLFMTGLETNRNSGATPDQTAQVCRWMKAYAPKNRIIVGSSQPDYLLAVAGKVDGIELWLEQADSLMATPLTLATAPAYLASLDKLAAKVGTNKVWAGEWWCSKVEDLRAITNQIILRGMNLGCGKFR